MDASSAAGSRPRRAAAQETRFRLLRAGRAAFAAKGLTGTNLKQDILEPAGVSVGSFYHQFQDKTELLRAILDEYSAAFRAGLKRVHQPAAGRSAAQIARSSYAMVLEMAERYEDLMLIHLRERHSDDPRVRDFLRADRERWVESLADDYRHLAGSSSVEHEMELLAQLIAGLSLGVLAHYLETPAEERPAARERLLDGLVRFTLGGICAFAGFSEP